MNALNSAMRWLGQASGWGGMSRQTMALIIAAAAIALYSAIHLYLDGRRERMRERVAALRAGPRDIAVDDTAIVVRQWHERMGAMLAASPAVGQSERARLNKILADAGFRQPGAVATLVLSKFLGSIVMAIAVWLLTRSSNFFTNQAVISAAALVAAALLGWRLPDLVIAVVARARKGRIEDAMPDALDLLVICVEAGLSLEQAISFVAREAKEAFPDLGKELEITAGELKVLGDRGEALRKLAQRLDFPAVRSIVATLIQTMKYGTPLTDSLRVLAAEMRTARLLRIEERAARLPVMLTLPLMLFILPCTFMVVGGPAALQVMDSFKSVHIGAPSR